MLKIWNMWLRYKTKNFTRIPLFVMFFDYQKYKKNMAKNAGEWFKKVEHGEIENPYVFEHSNEPDWYNAF